MRARIYRLLSLCMVGAVLFALAGRTAGNPPDLAAAGEALYREGTLISGQPLRAHRDHDQVLAGIDAACANCHRRSGLGTVEGRIVLPPIDSRALFHPGTHAWPGADGSEGHASARNLSAYDDTALARALRDGVGADGRTLDYLMPRFELDRSNMAALIGYLHQLGDKPAPGVEDETLHFATIVTPDADPVASGAMIDVLQQFFATRNASYRGDSPPLQSARRIHFRVLRQWRLHVWRLEGPSAGWEAQLDRHLRQEPVFAVIAGIGRATWEPVHRFCERAALPCLFPNVDLPVVAERDFYPIYFSQGVLLEARMLAYRISAAPEHQRVVQVFRGDDIGVQAAAALRAAAGSDFATEDRILAPAASAAQLAQATAVSGTDILVLWLRPGDVEALPEGGPSAAAVYASGLMGGLDAMPLPTAWQRVAEFTYPFELPERRRVRMNYPLGWFAIRHIPVVAERVQTDTYIACTILAEALGTMRDDFVRDYLVERVESMLSARVLNGYYPRLSLAPGQRFASKGGYFVHEAGPGHEPVVLAGGLWTVPWKAAAPR